jgi:membrane protein DedA with SNARE-associated domain
VTHVLQTYGLALLFLLVAVESMGVPVPGESALITAAALGRWPIELVIATAAAAAIVGDNVGYWLGRTGGRRFLERFGPVARHTQKALPRAERFFDKHGGKAVFLARFVAFLRITAAWVAGISRMPWWRFFAWNAAGGIAWATLVGLLAYFFGKTLAKSVGTYGLYAALVLLAAGGVGYFLYKRRRR